MKIVDIKTRLVHREISGGIWAPGIRWATKSMVLVFLETDEGQQGVGEAWTPLGTPDALVAVLERDIKPLVLGEDPYFFERIRHRALRQTLVSCRAGIVTAALSAVDIAMWDLLGKIHGVPLYRLLGAFRDKVYCYASAGLYGEEKTEQDLAREMAGYVRSGFTGVKMKIGGVPLKTDVRRVAAVREAVGPDIRLMVDAVNNLDETQALRWMKALEPFDVYFFEAPVHPDDIESMARLNALGIMPVTGNENSTSMDVFRELVRRRAVSFVQFDPIACGGITASRRIAHLAQAFHLPCTLHGASTSVVMAANLHLAASLPGCESVEYHMVHRWLYDLEPEGAFAVHDGYVRPPQAPGLGLKLESGMIDE